MSDKARIILIQMHAKKINRALKSHNHKKEHKQKQRTFIPQKPDMPRIPPGKAKKRSFFTHRNKYNYNCSQNQQPQKDHIPEILTKKNHRNRSRLKSCPHQQIPRDKIQAKPSDSVILIYMQKIRKDKSADAGNYKKKEYQSRNT